MFALDAVDYQCSSLYLRHLVLKRKELANFVWRSERYVEVHLWVELVDVRFETLREPFNPIAHEGRTM